MAASKKFQINVNLLHDIIDRHRRHQKVDGDLSDTIEFEIFEESDTHLGSDDFQVFVKSTYAECNSKPLTLKPDL